MSTPETIFQQREPIRPLKRVEYERLAAEGFFEDERVELLFGVVVPMTPIDPAHVKSARELRQLLERQLADRATVCNQDPFAASDISEPEPDVMVVAPAEDSWQTHPARALLVVEVARTSLRRDKGPKALLYGLAEVTEYWIVDHINGVVEVYREPHEGDWATKSTHRRGEIIAMLAFPDVTIAVSEILPPVGS